MEKPSVHHIQAEESDLSLLGKAGVCSSRVPAGRRSDVRRVSREELHCLAKLLPEIVGSEAETCGLHRKEMFFVLLLCHPVLVKLQHPR